MKKTLIILGLLTMMMAPRCFGQVTSEGVITYEVRINMHRQLPPEREDMKAMMPEFRMSKQQLFFNDHESLYKILIEEEDEEPTNTGPGPGRRILRMPNIEIYCDTHSDNVVTQQEVFDKTYLIEDTAKVLPWKFGPEKKNILGYECKQAYYTTTDERPQTITAWYCDRLRPMLGPERFNSLPGAVLAVDVNNNERVMVAQKIELRQLKKNELKKPEKGEKITNHEFRKMMEEQRKKMGGSPGPGGMMFRN